MPIAIYPDLKVIIEQNNKRTTNIIVLIINPDKMSDNSDKSLNESIPLLAELPIDPVLAKLIDEGKVEEYPSDKLQKTIETLNNL